MGEDDGGSLKESDGGSLKESNGAASSDNTCLEEKEVLNSHEKSNSLTRTPPSVI